MTDIYLRYIPKYIYGYCDVCQIWSRMTAYIFQSPPQPKRGMDGKYKYKNDDYYAVCQYCLEEVTT